MRMLTQMQIENQVKTPAVKIKSGIRLDYGYHTDTDDESKYITKKNKKFGKLSLSQKEAHIQRLWRICNVKAFACALMINQLTMLQTKINYFGK